MEDFLKKVKEGVEMREKNYKSDAYFYLPDEWESDEKIKAAVLGVRKMFEEQEKAYLVRLYSKCRIQVTMMFNATTNAYEHLMHTGPMDHIDQQLHFFNSIEETCKKNEIPHIITNTDHVNTIIHDVATSMNAWLLDSKE